MIAEILSVGTELLLGQTVDTNATFISQALSSVGIDLYYRATVGDNPDRMRTAMAASLERADILVTIGGLGPTLDDLTKEIACEVLGVETAIDPEQDQRLRELAKRRQFTPPASFFKQAVLPTKQYGRAIPNPNGTAPGVWAENNGKIVICLPGPPFEFIPMVEQSVIPWISERNSGERTVIRSQTLRLIGIGESWAEDKVKDLMDKGNPTVAPYAKLGECHLRITAKAGSEDAADKIIAPVEAEIRSRLGNAVYGINDETLELVCVRLLTERGQTVSTAESCTGGLLAGRITAISGSSAVFETGFITYANSAKQKLIGVSEETLEKYGAVSEETVREMALGAKSAAGSDYAVSVTGIAGPTGGTDEKPVGLVYIAVAKPDGNIAITKNQFPGRRNDVRNRAAHMALAQLREALIIV